MRTFWRTVSIVYPAVTIYESFLKVSDYTFLVPPETQILRLHLLHFIPIFFNSIFFNSIFCTPALSVSRTMSADFALPYFYAKACVVDMSLQNKTMFTPVCNVFKSAYGRTGPTTYDAGEKVQDMELGTYNVVDPFRSSYPRDAASVFALCSGEKPESRSACREAVWSSSVCNNAGREMTKKHQVTPILPPTIRSNPEHLELQRRSVANFMLCLTWYHGVYEI